MKDAPPQSTLTDALPSQVPGIHWPAMVGARDAAVLFQIESSQWLPETALRTRLSLQLRELLAHARRRCPFYRERLPNDLARWHEIALLTRTDLQTQAKAVRAAAYPRAHGKTFDITTGGSTGEPVSVRLQSEHLLVEVLNTQGQPCRHGEVGQVVVTDLHNFAMPLIRYALRDWAERGPVCACGRGLPTCAASWAEPGTWPSAPMANNSGPCWGCIAFGKSSRTCGNTSLYRLRAMPLR